MIGIRARRLAGGAALVAATVFAAAGSAQAATVNIGSLFTDTYTAAFTPIAQTSANSVLPAPAVAASPTDGTVISWRFFGAGPLTPRILRPAGGNTYTGTGTGPTQSGPAGVLLGPFPLSLPIRRGDLFGVDTQPMSSFRHNTSSGRTRLSWSPPLADGATSPPSGSFTSEWAVGAVVRYCIVPDLRGKKPFEAGPALAAADCTTGTATKAKKRRKKKRILTQSVPPGTSISDTAPVDFVFSPKKKKKRKRKKR